MFIDVRIQDDLRHTAGPNDADIFNRHRRAKSKMRHGFILAEVA